MTLERAYYHKLMLEAGLTERFDAELDALLEQENPLSELALALSTCGGDRNEQIHILNDHILSVPKEQIDSDAVFSLVAEDFRARYEQSPEALEQLTRKMGSVAWLSGWWTEDPWNAMYLMSDWYDDIEALLSREAFLESFRKLLFSGEVFDPLEAQRRKLQQNTVPARIQSFLSSRRRRKIRREPGEGLASARPNALFLPCRVRWGTAWFELQYCKTEGSLKKILDHPQLHWMSDSLIVYLDDQERLLDTYLPYLEHPESPDGSGTFCYYGINYYTKESTAQMLEQIRADRPEEWEVLLPWLEKAVSKYNGFYFLGI